MAKKPTEDEDRTARAARLGDVADIHYAWEMDLEKEEGTPYDPTFKQKASSDYGYHSAAVSATPEQESAFQAALVKRELS